MEFLTGAVQKEDLGIAEILAGDYEGKNIKVKGAIHTIRDMGEVAFIVLRRRDGLIQCVYEPGKSQFSVDDLKEADTVEVCGTYKSDDRSPNGFELRLDTITILSDPEVTKYLTWPAHESVDTTETILKEWISKYDEKDFYQWAIELNDLEQPIGTISAIKTDERVESVEIGYCIGKRFWNNGYMTEALTAIIRFFINEVGAGRIWARHDTENPNSGKVMVAAGMDYEGTLRHAGFNNQGICDEAVYAKVRSAALDEEPEEETPEQQAVTTKVMGEDGVMRNVISDETMEYVGILAKLELSPEEAEAAKKDMADMVDYIDKLEELDTSGIEPMSHVFPVNNVFRDDVVTNGDGSEATLANAPVKKDGGFKVPKTIGE